jgi:hypothetical protein
MQVLGQETAAKLAGLGFLEFRTGVSQQGDLAVSE